MISVLFVFSFASIGLVDNNEEMEFTGYVMEENGTYYEYDAEEVLDSFFAPEGAVDAELFEHYSEREAAAEVYNEEHYLTFDGLLTAFLDPGVELDDYRKGDPERLEDVVEEGDVIKEVSFDEEEGYKIGDPQPIIDPQLYDITFDDEAPVPVDETLMQVELIDVDNPEDYEVTFEGTEMYFDEDIGDQGGFHLTVDIEVKDRADDEIIEDLEKTKTALEEYTVELINLDGEGEVEASWNGKADLMSEEGDEFTVEYGTEVTFKADAGENYEFIEWTEDAEGKETEEFAISIEENYNLGVVFEQEDSWPSAKYSEIDPFYLVLEKGGWGVFDVFVRDQFNNPYNIENREDIELLDSKGDPLNEAEWVDEVKSELDENEVSTYVYGEETGIEENAEIKVEEETLEDEFHIEVMEEIAELSIDNDNLNEAFTDEEIPYTYDTDVEIELSETSYDGVRTEDLKAELEVIDEAGNVLLAEEEALEQIKDESIEVTLPVEELEIEEVSAYTAEVTVTASNAMPEKVTHEFFGS